MKQKVEVRRPIDEHLFELLNDSIANNSSSAIVDLSAISGIKVSLSNNAPRTACLLGTLHLINLHQHGSSFSYELQHIVSSTAATLLGRFGIGNETLAEKLRLIARHDAVSHDVVYADIVHLQQGRLANVMSTPDIREYDICFLGESSKERINILPVSDLYLTTLGGKLVLLSKRLGRQVMPMISNMHNFANSQALAVYRFLHTYSRANYSAAKFTWDRIGTDYPRRPRLCYNNLVLDAASWTLSSRDVFTICDSKTTDDAHRTLLYLLDQRQIPSDVRCGAADNLLRFDLSRKPDFLMFHYLVKGKKRPD